MPARIDPDQRRQQVVEAAFRLVVEGGLEGLSLRKVAVESGLNVGSVRHYFDGSQDLLVAAAEEAGERMGRRLARHPVEGLRGLTGETAIDAMRELVEELLPVDEERRDEAIVVLELILASRTRPVLETVAARMGRDLTAVLTGAFDALGVPDPGSRAAGLSALVGGLTIDAVTPHGALGVDQLRATLDSELRLHLAAIALGDTP